VFLRGVGNQVAPSFVAGVLRRLHVGSGIRLVYRLILHMSASSWRSGVVEGDGGGDGGGVGGSVPDNTAGGSS
jgi:hypothetical protein